MKNKIGAVNETTRRLFWGRKVFPDVLLHNEMKPPVPWRKSP